MSGWDLALDDARRERDLLARALADAEDDLAELERLVAKRQARAYLTTQPSGDPVTTATEDRAPVTRPRSDGGASTTGLARLLQSVFLEHPGALTVEEVYSALINRGWNTTSQDWRSYLTSKMSTMVTDGRLMRPGRGIYRLPSDEEAQPTFNERDHEGEGTNEEQERLMI